MTNILRETILSPDEARREPAFTRVVRGQKKPASIMAIYRAASHGLLSTTGTRVVLEAVKTPSGLRTSAEAIERFCAKLSGYDPSELEPTSSHQLVGSASGGNAEAAAILDRLGI